MSAYTSAIRSSLLSNAQSGASRIRQWSIFELMNVEGKASSSTASILGDGTGASVAVAEKLLQEVQLRLALQHGRVAGLTDKLSEVVEHIDGGNFNSKPITPPSIKGQSRVIKACNFPVSISIKEFSRRTDMAKLEGLKSMKCLKDLTQLHENTYQLPYQIIEGDGKAILENFNKPNQRYVSDIFDQIMARHGTSVETLADAVISVRNMKEMLKGISNRDLGYGKEVLSDDTIGSFLHSRLLIQLLCDHYMRLNKGKSTGAVSVGVDVVDVVDDAVTEAKHVCDANLGVAPEVCIEPDESINCDFDPPPIIRSWLHHAIVEVSKNAMTSNIEQWNMEPSLTKEPLPPNVRINISRKESNLTINVVDQGTGLNDESSDKAFRFADSTTQKRWNRLEEQQSYAAVRQPLGSLGVGLPLSRMMMRVFGGNLDLTNNNTYGSGCTAVLKISYDEHFLAKN